MTTLSELWRDLEEDHREYFYFPETVLDQLESGELVWGPDDTDWVMSAAGHSVDIYKRTTSLRLLGLLVEAGLVSTEDAVAVLHQGLQSPRPEVCRAAIKAVWQGKVLPLRQAVRAEGARLRVGSVKDLADRAADVLDNYARKVEA